MDTATVGEIAASPFAGLTFIAAPALLTNASSVLLLGTSNRLARAVDRVRYLAGNLEHHADTSDRLAQLELRQLKHAERRVRVIVRAMTAFYLAVGAFAFSTMVALIGAGLLTPEQAVWIPLVVRVTTTAAIVGVASLVYGALSLVFESRLTFSLLSAEADFVRTRYFGDGETGRRRPSGDAGA
jgi:hypothetical protein